MFTSLELNLKNLPVLNAAVSSYVELTGARAKMMLAKNGQSVQIDAVHARAICEEVGDRLRCMLRRNEPDRLPPRLQHLMEQLAGLDHDSAPSIVPTIEDMLPDSDQCAPSSVKIRQTRSKAGEPRVNAKRQVEDEDAADSPRRKVASP